MTKLNSNWKYLVEKYIANTCTREEMDQLIRLSEDEDYRTELYEMLKAHWEKTQPEQDSTTVDWNTKFAAMMKPENYGTTLISVGRKISKMWLSAAAVTTVVLTTAAWFYFHQSSKHQIAKTAQSKKIRNDVLPGGNRAVLTLSDGSQIILDSAHNGTVTKQGNTKIIKLDDGQLSYNALNEKPGEVVYNTISTPRGGQYEILLADGSRVWLNAASSLRFPTSFTGKERNVELTGEGYFEIFKNPSKPFHVKAGDMTVEVLGTHFNINAYNDEPSVKTTLLEGRVKITDHSSIVSLQPGQQAKLKDNELSVINNVDVDVVMSWKSGFFEFENTDLPTIMRQISRWYNVDVSFEGDHTTETFGGRISKDLNLSNILAMLETNGVKFRLEGKNLIVQP